MLHIVYGILVGFICLFASTAQSAGTGVQDESYTFHVAPEGHFYQDLHFFTQAKDTSMAKRFFLEWTSMGELAFFSVGKSFYFLGNMSFNVGLGSQGGIMIFDPRDIDIAFGLMAEYRFKTLNLSLDIDHRCFHQIDSPEWETMYWNRLTLAASSSRFRLGAFRDFIGTNQPLTLLDRYVWQLSASYYVRDLFGLLDTSALSWNIKYVADVNAETRFVAARFNEGAIVLNGKTGMFFTRTNNVLWNQQLGVALETTQGKFGLSFFLNWFVVDQLQIRQNRDKLLLFGINGYN